MSRIELSTCTPVRPLCTSFLFGLMVLFWIDSAPVLADPPLNQVGRWSSLVVFSPEDDQIIHQILMRDAEDSLRILFWGAKGAAAPARLWLFGSQDTLSPTIKVPQAGVNDFCGGHSSLATGEALIAGGTVPIGLEVGTKYLSIFNASLADAAHDWGWRKARNMGYGRWYPTNTTLNDGKVIITTGFESYYARAFGGRLGSGLSDSVWTYAQSDTTLLRRPTVSGTPPSRREGHAAIHDPLSNRTIIFGGYAGTGGYKNDVFALTRDYGTNANSEHWQWQTISPVDSAPAARSRPSFIYSGYGAQLMVLGGYDATSARSDFWSLSVETPGSEQWRQLPSPPASFSPRYGHVAIYDPGPDGGNQERMIVFGGTDDTNHFADVWSYALRTKTWSSISASGGPSGREGCVGFGRRTTSFGGTTLGIQLYIYGGRDDSNTFNETWVLKIDDGSNTGTWTKLTIVSPPAGNGQVPRGRTRAASVLGKYTYSGRLFVTGGQDSTDAPLPDSWWLVVRDTITVAEWLQRPVTPSPRPRYGHTLVDEDKEASGVVALFPERFDPRSAGSPVGGAEVLPYPLNVRLYPFMFLLPNGDLLYAGSSDDPVAETWSLNLASGWTRTANQNVTGHEGVSAVMYRPGKVMKCGNATSDDPSMPTDTISFNSSGLPGVWGATTNLSNQGGRTRLNLTLLPNGKVIATGGISNSGTPRQDPYIWNPDSLIWGAKLAQEPAVRGYHSTAVLLPDGRILSAGGVDTVYNNTMAMFWPPYLFNPNGQLATRPPINGAPDTLHYAQSFKLCTGNANNIQSVCLIRPSAVTHAFNEDQRYVPLTFSVHTSCRLTIDAPSDSNIAPPGDYMLFIVEGGVPSIAKWVRLKTSGPTATDCDCGGCPFVDAKTASGWREENTILNRSLSGRHEVDAYRIQSEPDIEGARYRLRIRENEREFTTLDEVSLVAVDRDPGVRSYRMGRQFLGATRTAPHRVTTYAGLDVTSLVDGSGNDFFVADAGETLFVDLVAPGATVSPVDPELDPFEIDDGGKGGGGGGGGGMVAGGPDLEGTSARNVDAEVLRTNGVLVQGRDAEGLWSTVRSHYPRENFAESLVDTLDEGPVRLVFQGRHRLRYVGRVLPTGVLDATRQTLIAARHSRLGSVESAVSDSGGSSTLLAPGDTLNLEFAATTVPSGKVRDLYLVSRGVYSSAMPNNPEHLTVQTLRFALFQNRPNPFSADTRIDFELPRPQKVRLEIFDLGGRRIRELVNASYQPGRWSVNWDRTDGRGSRCRTGVYLYRLTTEMYKAHLKMVVLR
jgi:hypothetical protein